MTAAVLIGLAAVGVLMVVALAALGALHDPDEVRFGGAVGVTPGTYRAYDAHADMELLLDRMLTRQEGQS